MSALTLQPILTFFFPCFIWTKKKGSTRSWQGWVIEVKKVLADKIKEIFSIIDFIKYIDFIYKFSRLKASRGVG